MAKALGLPPWWLNEQATAYISGKMTPESDGSLIIRAAGDGRLA